MTRHAAHRELERLAEVERQMTALDVERVRLMADAQRHGASWEAIGVALGITRQSAWEAYHLRVRHMLDATALLVGAGDDELLESAAASLSRVRARRQR